jgi:hypothetical protein
MKRAPPAFLAALTAALACSAMAQLAADDPDWKESQVQPPPAIDMKKKSLIPVRVSDSSQLKWFVDGDSVQITKDGVVRYVVIAQSDSGTVNAMYEGFRCTKAESRLYARHSPASGWVEQKDTDWKAASARSYSSRLAKLGLCDGAAPPASAKVAVERLIKPEPAGP